MKNDRCPPTKSAGGHSFDNFDGIIVAKGGNKIGRGGDIHWSPSGFLLDGGFTSRIDGLIL